MIGFIKNLFSSILSFFVGLFGGKKSLENKSSTTSAEKLAADTVKTGNKMLSSFTGLLGDKKSQENEPSTTSVEKLAADTVKTGNKMLSSFTGLLGDKKSQENEPSTTSAQAAAATAKPRKRSGYFMELDETQGMTSNGNQPKVTEAKTPEPIAAAKSAKEEPAKTSEAAASAQSAKVDLVQTAGGVKAVPAEREKAPIASANRQNPTETTFAPKYLAPNSTSNSRRRPGPSMNPFLDMARQVKNPG